MSSESDMHTVASTWSLEFCGVGFKYFEGSNGNGSGCWSNGGVRMGKRELENGN